MGRAPCCDKTKVKRGPWSPDEDDALRAYLHSHGSPGNWISLPHKAGLKRCGKSCRLRWLNYLRPHIKRGSFTQEEDDTILSLYSKIGSRWSVIAAKLPGRTDNDVKNHWNTKLKKKLIVGETLKKTAPNYQAASHNSNTSSSFVEFGSNANPNSLLDHNNNNNNTSSSQISQITQQQLYHPSFSYLLAQGSYNSSLTNALLLDQFMYTSPLDPRTEHSPLQVGHLEATSSAVIGSSPSLVKEEADSYFAYPYHGSNIMEDDLLLDQLDAGLGFEPFIASDDSKAAFDPGYAYGISEKQNLAS